MFSSFMGQFVLKIFVRVHVFDRNIVTETKQSYSTVFNENVLLVAPEHKL